jgi:hypothetical protein
MSPFPNFKVDSLENSPENQHFPWEVVFTMFPGEKTIVKLLCILGVSGYWGFFFHGGNGASTWFSPLFHEEMSGVMPKGMIFLPQLVWWRKTIPRETSVVMSQGFILR